MLDNGYTIFIGKLETWYEGLVAMLPNAVLAILVIVAFGIASRIAGRLARRMMDSVSDSEAVTFLVGALTRYSILIVGLFVSLGVIGLQKTVTSLLAGAGIVGLAIGFAFQDLAANFIAGVMMGFRKPFEIGDIVETQDYLGKVEAINLRNTILETFEGHRVILPNKDVFENALVNYSTTGRRRVDIKVGVGYGSDLEEVTRVATEAIASLEFVADDKGVDVVAESFGGSSVDFEVRFWIPYPDGQVGFPEAKHRGILAIHAAFDAHDIEIPFPIRTLDFAPTSEMPARFALLNGGGEAGVASQPDSVGASN